MGAGRRFGAAPWLLVALVAGCVAPESADKPKWTWVAGDWDGTEIKIEPAGEDRWVALRHGWDGVASLALLDGEGQMVWSRRLGGLGGEVYPRSVAVGDDGTIYVGGSFSGTVAFGDDTTAVANQACQYLNGVGTCSEGFVAAYDQAAELRWVWRVGRSVEGHLSRVIHLAATGDGVVVSGWSARWVAPSTEEIAPAHPGGATFVARLDAAGTEVWRYRDVVAGGGFRDMVIDASGAILRSVQYVDWDPLRGPRGFWVLVKLTPDGQEVWRRDVDGGLMAPTEDGDVIVTGQFDELGVEPVGSYTLYVHRYDGVTGELRWRRFLGDEQRGQVYAYDVAIDPAGDVVVLGFMTGLVAVGESTLEVVGPADLFIARLRGEDGWPLAGATFGIADADAGGSLLVLDRDDMIVAGGFTGELSLDGRIKITPPDTWCAYARRGNPFAPD